MNKLKKIFPYFILTIIIIITFWDLPKTFFQQDEWWSLGEFINRESLGGITKVIQDSFLASGKVHVNPLTELIFYLQYKLFNMNFSGFALFSILNHVINSFLVYYFVTLILKNKYISLFTAMLFGVNSISHQGVSWIAASLNTQGSTFFSLLSAIFFFDYVSKEHNNKKLLYISSALTVTALLFKETVLPFFLIGGIWLVYSAEKKIIVLKKILFSLILIFSAYGLLRVIVWMIAPPIILGLTEVQTQPGIPVFLYRIITLPFKVLPQSIFPASFLLDMSRTLMHLAYPFFIASDGFPNPYVVETVGLDLVSYFISAILILVSILGVKLLIKNKQKDLVLGLSVSIFAIIGGITSIIFIPGYAGFVSLIEPRHMYAGSFGVSAFMVIIIYTMINYYAKIKKSIILTGLVMIVIYLFHINLVRVDITNLKLVSDLRKSFLVDIEKAYPNLPEKVVFYIQSDTAYYGMPIEEKNLPVQSGFGRMLMLWYQKKEDLQGCLYENLFLHDLIAQGYKNCDGRGFGYFRDYDKFIKAMKENNILQNEIIAYSWNSKIQEFKDITKNIRNKVKDELR